ncbi:hypothetical protein [Escherichia coli]|uniref:hypothetical protein n=1 Tax=Escherichia coli TaxID=562 RepID=UPI0039A5BD7C
MCQDLVDCAAWWENNMIKGRAMRWPSSEKLASVYGITVPTDIDSFPHGAGFCHQLGGSRRSKSSTASAGMRGCCITYLRMAACS